MNYQMHFDPYLREHLRHQREEELAQEAEMLALQRRVRKNRKVRGSSRLFALVERGRLLLKGRGRRRCTSKGACAA